MYAVQWKYWYYQPLMLKRRCKRDPKEQEMSLNGWQNPGCNQGWEGGGEPVNHNLVSIWLKSGRCKMTAKKCINDSANPPWWKTTASISHQRGDGGGGYKRGVRVISCSVWPQMWQQTPLHLFFQFPVLQLPIIWVVMKYFPACIYSHLWCLMMLDGRFSPYSLPPSFPPMSARVT